MSCTPADITSDITNSCDLKCKLVTDYPSQGIICNGYTEIANVGLQLAIEGIENLTSELNFTPYTAMVTWIVQPSWHRYSGKRVAAEMIILHQSGSGENLFICIPIIEGNSSSDLDDIIHKAGMSQASPFNLNTFIPQHPYYSYKGGFNTRDSCEGGWLGEIIVFQKRHALRLLNENLNIIPTGINYKFATQDGESISFSKNKPLKNENDASFPITCEPYDDPDMESEIEKKKKFRSPFTMSDKDFQEWSSNVAIQIIIGALVLYLLVKFLFLITSLGTKKPSISSMEGGTLIMGSS